MFLTCCVVLSDFEAQNPTFSIEVPRPTCQWMPQTWASSGAQRMSIYRFRMLRKKFLVFEYLFRLVKFPWPYDPCAYHCASLPVYTFVVITPSPMKLGAATITGRSRGLRYNTLVSEDRDMRKKICCTYIANYFGIVVLNNRTADNVGTRRDVNSCWINCTAFAVLSASPAVRYSFVYRCRIIGNTISWDLSVNRILLSTRMVPQALPFAP